MPQAREPVPVFMPKKSTLFASAKFIGTAAAIGGAIWALFSFSVNLDLQYRTVKALEKMAASCGK